MQKKKNSKRLGKEELRSEAVERLKHKKIESKDDFAKEDLITLVHELQIHQIELEMQNEELNRINVENEELKNKYFELYDLAPSGYLTLDKYGKILELNLTAANYFKKDKSLITGFNFINFIDPSSKNDFVKFMKNAFSLKQKQTSVFKVKTGINDFQYFQINGMAIEEPGSVKNNLWMTIVDITRNIMLEKELTKRESDDRYRILFNTMSECLMLCELLYDEKGMRKDYRILEINYSIEKFTGLKNQKVKGMLVSEVFHDYDIFEINKFSDISPTYKSIRFETHSGTLNRDFAVSAYYPEPGKLALLYADITEHKNIIKELQKAKDAAEDASRLKNQFIANVSHELRTPLNAVLGYAQLLKKSKNLSEKETHSLDAIDNSGQNLLNLINDILDNSILETGKMKLEKKAFNLPEMLGKIFDIIGVQSDEKSLALSLEATSDLPVKVLGDENKLQQVLLNLLSNAVKFTGKGKIVLRIGVIKNEDKTNEKNKIGIHFEIADTGMGIKDEDQKLIFDSFNQLDINKTKPKGAGLGLTISRDLVKLMGGELFVKSEPGKGSTFWFDMVFDVLNGEYASISFENHNKKKDEDLMDDAAVPPDKDLRMMYSMAKNGDIINLRKYLEKIENENPDFSPFTSRLKLLAANIDLSGIESVLEKYI